MDIKDKVKEHSIVFWCCFVVSVGLMVVGFFTPPQGEIDGSVLKASGILFGFAALGQLPKLIKGRSVELKHGETKVTLGDDD